LEISDAGCVHSIHLRRYFLWATLRCRTLNSYLKGPQYCTGISMTSGPFPGNMRCRRYPHPIYSKSDIVQDEYCPRGTVLSPRTTMSLAFYLWIHATGVAKNVFVQCHRLPCPRSRSLRMSNRFCYPIRSLCEASAPAQPGRCWGYGHANDVPTNVCRGRSEDGG
jgi:hypothetical protein